MASCGERATALLAAACKHTDALLPLPLPHTRALKQRPQRACSLTPVLSLQSTMKLAMCMCHEAVTNIADSMLVCSTCVVHITMLNACPDV